MWAIERNPASAEEDAVLFEDRTLELVLQRQLELTSRRQG